MNPIYRHSFVNAFLANGAISNTTGNINGNNTNFYYTRTFVPVGKRLGKRPERHKYGI